MRKRHTIVGDVDADVLAFTAGKDLALDARLVEADCIGSAAHATMLSRRPAGRPVLTRRQAARIVRELVRLMRTARAGAFVIRPEDQDVHLAVERLLTERLGEFSRKIHTGRSRNDQVAVDLRLYGKEQLLGLTEDALALADGLLRFARQHLLWPMVGRTHMQPAMPSSVGLWASAHAEGLLEDLTTVRAAYENNDRSPLGSAAGYGVPLAIDRTLTARLLGFREPHCNVLHASNARGKCELNILWAAAQIMLTLSRLAEDLILYSMPEFGYFSLPAEMCTGSSIMPQKRNPDVLELVRAKTSRALAGAAAVAGVLNGLSSGYSRDLQETKEPFMDALDTARSSLRVLQPLIRGLVVNRTALLAGFTPEVFAADRALELVAQGVSFRNAYLTVRAQLGELRSVKPGPAVSARFGAGASAEIKLGPLTAWLNRIKKFVRSEKARYYGAVSNLLGVTYPDVNKEDA